MPITFTGVVTKVEWLNPHARFYVDVKDDKGAVNNWECELASPNGLMRIGWKRDSLKIGEEITVEGFRARDGSFEAGAGLLRRRACAGHDATPGRIAAQIRAT